MARNGKKNKGRRKTGSWENQETDALVRAFKLLENECEIKQFLRDLLTEAELLEIGNRFKAARMLTKGIHYSAIVEDTGLSSATIARVQKWRKSGMGGYKIALARLRNET